MKRHLPLVAAAFFCSVASLHLSAQQSQPAASEQPTLSARDVFWSANDLVGGVTPNPATKQLASLNVPPPMSQRRARPARTASKTRQIDPNVVASSGYGAQPHLVRAAENRLGLRYTILEQDAGGQYSEVLPTSTFHTNDRVKLSVMANATGYLYLIQQGSSGTWSSVFPAADAGKESNHVEAGRVYLVPTDGTTFQFTGPAGTEKLYLVLSRERVDDLDRMIFGLGKAAKATPAKAEPEATAADSGPMQEATNSVSDALVQRMAGRDLTPVKEQVNSSAGPAKQDGEKAMYVVSASASSAGDARLIADFTLDHQ